MRTRGKIRGGIVAIVAIVVLFVSWAIIAVNGESSATAYLNERTEAVQNTNDFASRVDAIAIAAAEANWPGRTFVDTSETQLNTVAESCPTERTPLVPGTTPLPTFDTVPLGELWPAYAAVAGLHQRDVAAYAALDDAGSSAPTAASADRQLCRFAATLAQVQSSAMSNTSEAAADLIRDLAQATPEGVKVTVSMQPGTPLVTVSCNGDVGCTSVDDGVFAAFLSGELQDRAVTPANAYQGAINTCVTPELAELCAALGAQFTAWHDDESAIFLATATQDDAATTSAIATRDAHWAEHAALVQDELDALGAATLGDALQQARIDLWEPILTAAQEARITW